MKTLKNKIAAITIAIILSMTAATPVIRALTDSRG